ncbi:MAG TPA: DUF1345 domain-containing protein [Mycobacterium sp.]|nr:DUF1345 domain-containing protein [Mycobacterium sp.]
MNVAVRFGAAAVLGVLAALAMGLTVGWPYAPPSGWITAAAVYLTWTWLLVGRMDATATRAHATVHGEDDSTPRTAELVVVLASIASLVGVGYLLAAAQGHNLPAAVVGILSVASSWLAVHTTFTLRYARLYFPDKTVDFHQDDIEPTYADFAYLSFTVGMTYQVSDTDLKGYGIRRAVLFQALVSFLLGAIILAMTINLVAGLLNVGN